jgi:hypothetical protein
MCEYHKDWQPRQVLKCPHCGAEFLPGEIFYPDNVIGGCTEIIRDPLNKIIYEDYREGEEPLEVEHFECPFCEKPFIARVHLTFETAKEDEALDFSEETVKLF